jgi:ankyrin repeat protein
MFASALSNNNTKVIEKFLSQGIDINEKNNLGNTPLMAAAANPLNDIVRYLIVEGADVTHLDFQGRNALMLAAWMNPNPEVIRTLLFAGSDPTLKSKNGEDSLVFAQNNPNPEVKKVIEEYIKRVKNS